MVVKYLHRIHARYEHFITHSLYQRHTNPEHNKTITTDREYENGLFQKKTNRVGGEGGGALRTYVFKPPSLPGIFRFFLLYPREFQKKQDFTPRNSAKLCYTPWKC